MPERPFFPEIMMQDSKRQLLHLSLIILVAAAVFANSLANGFVWDDGLYVVGNSVYKNFDVHGMFTSLGNGREYLPLRDITYAIDYLFWGDRPAGFHFTNLLTYLANLVALYFMVLQLFRLSRLQQSLKNADAASCALLAVLLFAAHPIHSEAVAWVTGRNVLLSGFFFFLSCHLYLKHLTAEKPSPGFYAGAFVCYLCALLSKSTAIVLPLTLLLFVAFDSPEKWRRRALSLIPFFLLMSLFFVAFKKIGLMAETIHTRGMLPGSALSAKIAVSLQIPLFYLQKLFWPSGFSAEYDTVFALSLREPATLGAIAGVVLLLVAAAIVWKRFPEAGLGLAWFMLTLVPVLHFLPTNPFVADRYAYLPSFGPLFVAATLVTRLGAQRSTKVATVCGTLLVLTFSTLAFARNAVWKSEKTLWEDTIRQSPRQIKAYYNLGNEYYQEGNYEKAFFYFRKIRDMNYYYDYYDLFKGQLFLNKGDLAAALASFQQALAVNPHHLEALVRVAYIYEKQEDYSRAMAYYERIVYSQDQDTEGLRAKAAAKLQKLQMNSGNR